MWGLEDYICFYVVSLQQQKIIAKGQSIPISWLGVSQLMCQNPTIDLTGHVPMPVQDSKA